MVRGMHLRHPTVLAVWMMMMVGYRYDYLCIFRLQFYCFWLGFFGEEGGGEDGAHAFVKQVFCENCVNKICYCRRDEHAKQTEKETSERNLQTLKSSRDNRLKRFGNWVPGALAKIEEWCQQGKFHKRPRGPLGKCWVSLFWFAWLVLSSRFFCIVDTNFMQFMKDWKSHGIWRKNNWGLNNF